MNPDESAAIDPAQSVVVTACAGGGKTRLLVSRVANLLRHGAKPGEILAVTFTRKAAAEIRARVLDVLRDDAPDIRRKILLAESPEDILVVNTFHGWFLSLLALRPWSDSRRDPPRVGDDSEAPLLNDAWREWLRKESDSDAAKELSRFVTPNATRKLLFQFARRSAPWRLRERVYGPAQSGAEEDEARESESALRLAAKHFAEKADGAGKVFEGAKAAAQQFTGGAMSEDELRAAFLTVKNEPRARLTTSNDADVDGMVSALLRRLEAADTLRAAGFSRAALSAGAAFVRELDSAKARRHIAGFDDLEFAAWESVAQEREGEALRYRLDCKYRHILIDEFQDTSPTQWQIMRAWLMDAHGSDESPSVFIVGDPRQAIYYWRGGDPRLLESAAKFLGEHYNAKRVSQNICRRCAPQVLDAVNEVFSEADGFVPHESPEDNRDAPGTSGRVEWMVFEKESSPAPAVRMRDPLARAPGESEDPMRARWAEHIAETTARVLREWRIDDKPVREDDILILLRQFTHAGVLLEKMSARGINCASGGAFIRETECADILDLAKFLASPTRDLPLARALKSPVFSLTDDALRDIALSSPNDDGGTKNGDSRKDSRKLTLWEKLRASANVSPEATRACDLLLRWRDWAERLHLPAHDLLSRIYHDGEIVSRYLASVPEALRARVAANLSALLDLALMMDGGRRPLLAQFLAGCERGEADDETASGADIAESSDAGKSDGAGIRGGGGGVKILTAHKAKGLEAAVVILADANFSEAGDGGRGDSADILIDWPPDSPAPESFVARPRSAPMAWRESAARDKSAKEREDDNILYVAMTRARRALFLFSPGEVDKGPAARFNLFAKLAALPGASGDESAGHVGVSFDAPPGEFSAKADSESPPELSAIPRGASAERTSEMMAGEVRHRLVALLLSGFSDAEALRLLPSGVRDAARRLSEAKTAAESPAMRSLRDGAESVEVEPDFADERGVFRPDLIITRDGTTWVVDYKSGGSAPEVHRPQLRRYARALAKQRNGKIIAAILTATGELREVGV